MDFRFKKIAVLSIGVAVFTGTIMSVARPEHAAAAVKWLHLNPVASVQADDSTIVTAANSQIIETAIGEVVMSFHSNHKPDVGPGVEGLDYDKVVKWQQNVDEGRELWRLDPMQVAKIEGKNYGFTEQDIFTMVKSVNSSELSRHGQIDIDVTHQGKTYKMILVKPFGGGDAIWTTYKVYGETVNIPEKPEETAVLFETDKYADWTWYNAKYPQDMFFSTIVNFNGHLYYDSRISKQLADKFQAAEFNNKLILFANLGASSAKSAIGIEKVTITGHNMTVYVHTKSPKPGEIITMNILYPNDYIAIDRNVVDELGSVNITFVDQKGKILSKNKLTIKG